MLVIINFFYDIKLLKYRYYIIYKILNLLWKFIYGKFINFTYYIFFSCGKMAKFLYLFIFITLSKYFCG